MIMTSVLAETLMDSLMCLAISANGGYSPNLNTEQIELAEQYACDKFAEICKEWETLKGEPWEIEVINQQETMEEM